MSLLEAIIVLVVGLVAWETLVWAIKRDFLAIGLFRLRMRLRRQLPVGRYREEGPNSLAVGKPDSVVVFRTRLQETPERRSAVHVGMTDATTRFMVGDGVVEVDPFLEAYDAELGPVVAQVDEPGRIATIGIDTDARRAE